MFHRTTLEILLILYSGNVPQHKNAASKSLPDPNIPQESISTVDHAKKISSKVLNSLGQYVPSSNLGVIIAITSLCITLLITCCVACSRCRKRGKGKKYLYPTGINMFMHFRVSILCKSDGKYILSYLQPS